ncbi:MAG: hypothetical protein ACYDD0_08610 [Candidatus Dormibacteria bacterium]
MAAPAKIAFPLPNAKRRTNPAPRARASKLEHRMLAGNTRPASWFGAVARRFMEMER